MSPPTNPLPKDSLVLVTGINGYIGSHVADQLLTAGYRVRGTVRSAEKGSWIIPFFSSRHNFAPDTGRVEITVVPDMSAPGAFTSDLLKGCSAFIHVASDLSFSPDPKAIIDPTIFAAEEAVKACLKEPGIRHFVYTSSSAAAWDMEFDKPSTVTADSWNEACEKLAYEAGPLQALHVYSAAKAGAEKAVLKYATRDDVNFSVNSVVPNFNVGPILKPDQQTGSSAGMFVKLYQEGWDGLGMFAAMPSQHYVDVRDDAKLHVASLLRPDVVHTGERLFGAVASFTFNEVLQIYRELYPEGQFAQESDDKRKDMHDVVANQRSDAVLKKVFGEGFVTLKQSVSDLLTSAM